MKKNTIKLSNDRITKNVKIRKQLKIVIIILQLLTIVLAFTSLLTEISILYALVCLAVEMLLSTYRTSLDPKRKEV